MSELPWLDAAASFLGIKEGPGPANNAKVMAFFKAVGHDDVENDSTPWCAAFVGACLERAGLRSTRGLAAVGYERWGSHLDAPLYGCIGVKRRGDDPRSWQRHVGFVVAGNKDSLWMLGGNQGDSVSIARFDRRDFTAWRWPTGVILSVPRLLPASVADALSAVSEA